MYDDKDCIKGAVTGIEVVSGASIQVRVDWPSTFCMGDSPKHSSSRFLILSINAKFIPKNH